MKALVTGATGFVGRSMIEHLNSSVVLSRDAKRAAKLLGMDSCFQWKLLEEFPEPQVFEGVDTVFHLAGEAVAEGRWTRTKKHLIEATRVVGTRNLVDGILALDNPPKTLISASAVGIYGSRGDEVLNECSNLSDCFLGNVCQGWEREALRAEEAGVRVVNVRIGIVLGLSGGALRSMLPLFRMGLAGRLGSGRQWMPWIHRTDLVRLMLHLAVDQRIRGAVNASAPNPVRNQEFTRVLAASLKRSAIFPAPAFALRLALGEFSTVLLSSQRVVPEVATQSGFAFEYSELETALAEILSN